MIDRSKLLKSAWAQYRRVAFRNRPFNPDTFAAVLRFVWKQAKAAAVYTRVREADAKATAAAAALAVTIAKPMSEMERRIDDLKYLPFRYSAVAAEAAIRAEYGVAA